MNNPTDFLIKTIEKDCSCPPVGGISLQFVANREILVENFDYFAACVKYNKAACESVLDLGLMFGSIELCYKLITNLAELDNGMDYDTIIGVLEVCNVLQCKNQTFLDDTSRWLVNKLDMEDYEIVNTVHEKLKSNTLMCFKLKGSIRLRILYKINPSGLFSISSERIENNPEVGRIMLVIYPKKLWIRGREYDNDKHYNNWGELHVFNHNKEDVNQIVYCGKNEYYLKCMGILFRLQNIKNKNGESLKTIFFQPFCDRYHNKVHLHVVPNKFKFLVISNIGSRFVDCDYKRSNAILQFSNELLGNDDSMFVLTILYKHPHDPGNIFYLL